MSQKAAAPMHGAAEQGTFTLALALALAPVALQPSAAFLGGKPFRS